MFSVFYPRLAAVVLLSTIVLISQQVASQTEYIANPEGYPKAKGEYMDCRYSACIFAVEAEPVYENHILEYISLPKNFIISVDYWFDEIPDIAAVQGSQHLQNIYEIWNINKTKSLFSINRMWYGGLSLKAYYNNEDVIFPSGQGFEFQFGWNNLKIKLRERTLSIYGRTYSVNEKPQVMVFQLPDDGTVQSDGNVFYASHKINEYRPRRRYISGGGKIKNVFISGSLCCSSTSYYDLPWRDICVDGGDNKLPADISMCNTCITYQCLDWLVGSAVMKEREASYYDRTGEDVYLGVGAIGTSNREAGKCYRIKSNKIDRDVLVQAVTTSEYQIPTGSFMMMMAGGGFQNGGANGCTDYAINEEQSPPFRTNYPQFDGPIDQYGDSEDEGFKQDRGSYSGGWYNGGWTNREDCNKLPKEPTCSRIPDDNQPQLCRYSFDKGFRADGHYDGVNATKITKMCEIQCPSELVEATGLKRADEVSTTQCFNQEVPVEDAPDLIPIMNCAQPTFAQKSKTADLIMAEGYETAVPCRRDGYTRINAVPTFQPTPSPTLPRNQTPSSMPSTQPSIQPTSSPSFMLGSSRSPSFVPTVETTGSPTTNETQPPPEKTFLGVPHFWQTEVHGYTFFQLVAAAATGLVSLAVLLICIFETALFRKQDKERSIREEERLRKWDSIENEDDYEQEEYDEDYDSEDEVVKRDYGLDSSSASSIQGDNNFVQHALTGLSSFTESDVEMHSRSMHRTPALQRMEVGVGSAPSSDGSRGGAGLFTSPTAWMTSSYDNADYQSRERTGSNPMLQSGVGDYDR